MTDSFSEKTATSHSERLEDIINFMDNLIIEGSEYIYTKTELLDIIKNEYINKRSLQLTLPWLSHDNEDACRWAWNYTTDYHKKYNIKIKNHQDFHITREGVTLHNDFTTDYNPDESSLQEYVLAVSAAFELWFAGDDARELFITKIKRAWSQYNLRHSRKDKKPINCFVKAAVKNKLEKYCEKTDRTITDVIETLITQHCKPPY